MNYEERRRRFVEAWMKHNGNYRAVAKEVGLKLSSVGPLAARLRKRGVKLPMGMTITTKTEVERLNEIIEKHGKVKK